LIKGRIEFQNTELDDLIIWRTDGTPTYNFCVVVDDVTMKITEVVGRRSRTTRPGRSFSIRPSSIPFPDSPTFP
jgi:glutamyl-tRNA synthetase